VPGRRVLAEGIALAQQPPPRSLTIEEAITLALKNNLSVRLADAQAAEAAGTRDRRLALLLPRASGDSFAIRRNLNLQVQGISIPGFPSVVGPYSFYDFRFFSSVPLVDRQAYHNWKASKEQEQAAVYSYQDARDLVVRQAAGLYLQSESAAAEVESAQSRVTTSQELEKLARDQHTSGLATAVDVVRAQVQLARDQQNLLVARDAYQTSLLVLARFLGLPPGTPIELAARLVYRPAAVPDVDEALPKALEARSDYRSLVAQRDALIEQQKASHARYLPTLSLNGDYGPMGRNFGSLPGIGEIQATLSVDLFDRDRNGEQKQLASRLQGVNDQIADLARGIEQELRKAILDLQSTDDQVKVTQMAVDLARRELALAEDRFRNGVTDNIEVVTAQDALAAAQDDSIAALAEHADARMALARALGATEKNYRTFLPGSEPDPGRGDGKEVNQQ
jgi:outer membrane protein TolC